MEIEKFSRDFQFLQDESSPDTESFLMGLPGIVKLNVKKVTEKQPDLFFNVINSIPRESIKIEEFSLSDNYVQFIYSEGTKGKVKPTLWIYKTFIIKAKSLTMKHITILERGSYLGTSAELLVLKESGKLVKEWPLRRVRTITVGHSGISLSTNLIVELAKFSIPLYVMDFKGSHIAQTAGLHHHGVGQLRRSQILFLESERRRARLAAQILYGKIRNQRAVLMYFSKNLKDSRKDNLIKIKETLKKQSQSFLFRTQNITH